MGIAQCATGFHEAVLELALDMLNINGVFRFCTKHVSILMRNGVSSSGLARTVSGLFYYPVCRMLCRWVIGAIYA